MEKQIVPEVPSLLSVRRILDHFCKDHDLCISDPIATGAAHRLMAAVSAAHDSDEILRADLDAWFVERMIKDTANIHSWSRKE